jgi:hypothetical protein
MGNREEGLPRRRLTASNWHPASHYTQMIWRDTTALGCGEAICDKTLIVACNYDPPGNYIGRRPYWRPGQSSPQQLQLQVFP